MLELELTGLELRDEIVERAAAVTLGNQTALVKVAELCTHPAATARSVALEAAKDEGFSALLLRIANSAYSASTTQVAELAGAVARLGFRLVQGLALAAPGLRLLVGTHDELAPQRAALHQHAVRTALAARMLAATEAEADRALTAGLVHNLGLTILSLYAKDAFAQLARAAGDGRQLRPIEEEELGFTHAELGALVGSRWGYPQLLLATIMEHDAPAPSGALAAQIQVADALVRESGVGLEAPCDPSPAALALAGVELGTARARVSVVLESFARLAEREAGDGDGAAPPPASRIDFLTEALSGLS